MQFKRSIVVSCPVDKAFDYVSDWQNLKSFLSNILDITPISFVQYGPGAAFDTVFKVGGANIPTTLDVQEFVRDQRLILRSRHGLKVIGGWEFKPIGSGTSITFSLQYDLPPGLVRTAKDKELIEKDFSDAASQSLQLLKWVLESPTIRDRE